MNTSEMKQRFLGAYEQNEAKLKAACRQSGISTSTFYRWIRSDRAFNLAVCQIMNREVYEVGL